MTTETVFIQGAGGAIFERTVPDEGTYAADLWAEGLAKGEFQIIPTAEWRDMGDGLRKLFLPDAPPDAAPGTRTPAPKKVTTEAIVEPGFTR